MADKIPTLTQFNLAEGDEGYLLEIGGSDGRVLQVAATGEQLDAIIEPSTPCCPTRMTPSTTPRPDFRRSLRPETLGSRPRRSLYARSRCRTREDD